MITLISGGPRNGKTLYAMMLIEQAKKENDKLVQSGKAEPRNFYSNIDGVNLDYVHFAEKDWRQYPDGSFIVYDEAHQVHLFPATGKPGRADDIIINQMDEHGHRGFDLILITQWPSKVHHEVRQLVTRHFHVHRPMGMELAGVTQWDRCQLDPYDKDAKATGMEDTWNYPKHLYQTYKSATLHSTSSTFQMPAKMKNFLLSIPFIIAIVWGCYYLMRYYVSPMVIPPEKESTQQTESPSPVDSLLISAGAGDSRRPPPREQDTNLLPSTGEYHWQQSQTAQSIGGCVASEKSCRCFNSEGNVMDLRIDQCRNILESPLPFNVFHDYKETRNQSGWGVGVSPTVTPLTSESNFESLSNGPVGSRTEPYSVGPPADKIKGWIRSY